MTALLRFNMRRKGFAELQQVLKQTGDLLTMPLAGPRGLAVQRVMQKGVASQFDRGGDPQWPESKPFGNRQPSRPPLGGSGGTIGQIWANAPVEKGPKEVRIRVSDVRALAHQRGAVVKPRQDASHMRLALGRGFGVWITPERLNAGLVIPQRPIRYTDEMLLSTKAVLFLDFSPA